MSDDSVKDSIENQRAYALKATTDMWRETLSLSTDRRVPAESRAFYKQQAEEFHEEMMKLGHKH